MGMVSIQNQQIPLSLFLVVFLFPFTYSQQNYSGTATFTCRNNDEEGPSSAFLYTCNGVRKSCKAFLIFRSNPPYISIHAISDLTSSNPEELLRINQNTLFPTNKEVIIPVVCSCTDDKNYYQANTTYITRNYDSYYTTAYTTYEGLSTCDALKRANPYDELQVKTGLKLSVPLRCACPTRKQTESGTMYLLTYPVYLNEKIVDIATRFNVSTQIIVQANGLSSENSKLDPFTTILIPLSTEPSVSQTVIHSDPLSPAMNKKGNSGKKRLYLGVSIASACLLFISVGMVWYRLIIFKERSQGLFDKDTNRISKWVPVRDIRIEIASIEYDLKLFRFEEIKRATDNFNAQNKLKGSVYKGVFNKKTMAVKKGSRDAPEEVNMLKRINHFNLTKLEGYCEKHESFFLVFEYMEGGSLRDWLDRNGTEAEHSCWERRIHIALDVANGLHYLHNFTKPCYVHRNVTTSNILLDNNLRAKIANFSLVQTADRCGSLTTSVVGARGYMAPEYLEAGLVSTQMDVYAFGVVLLELITGKDPIVMQEGKVVPLSAVTVALMENSDDEVGLSLFVDPNLTVNAEDFAMPLTKLCLACLTQEPAKRPSMEDIVSSLLKIYTTACRKRYNSCQTLEERDP